MSAPVRGVLTLKRRAAAVDAVPSPDHTQRGCSSPLLRHQHHDAQIQTRSLTRPAETWTVSADEDTYASTRTHGRAGDEYYSEQQTDEDEDAERGELHRAASHSDTSKKETSL